MVPAPGKKMGLRSHQNNPEGILKKQFGTVGIVLFVIIGILLMFLGIWALPLARARILGQTNSVVQGFYAVAGFAQLALPRVAVYLADAFLVLLGALVLLFIHLLVMVPVQLHVLQRQVRSLDEQVNALRQEMGQARALLAEAAPSFRTPRSLEEGGIVTRSPLGPIAPARDAEG